jgi:hypothetical protein
MSHLPKSSYMIILYSSFLIDVQTSYQSGYSMWVWEGNQLPVHELPVARDACDLQISHLLPAVFKQPRRQILHTWSGLQSSLVSSSTLRKVQVDPARPQTLSAMWNSSATTGWS